MTETAISTALKMRTIDRSAAESLRDQAEALREEAEAHDREADRLQNMMAANKGLAVICRKRAEEYEAAASRL